MRTTSILYFLVLIYAFSSAAYSATYIVNQPGDNGDLVCDATCTLRDAVYTANNTEPLTDTITFAPFLTRITLNNEIAIDTLGQLSINGPGADRLTIDGGPGSNRIFYVFSSGGSSSGLDISGLTLTGGNGAGTAASGRGGAIFVVSPSSSRLFGIHITGNTANFGGGIAYESSGLTVFDSTISNNTATGNCGGFQNDGDGMLIVNSTISGNTSGGDGGGVCHINSGEMNWVTITNNTAFRGGGIAIRSFSGEFRFSNSIIAGNHHSGGNNPEIYRNDPPANFVSQGFNIIGDDPGDSADTNVPVTYDPIDILDTDPQLIALGNNGGPTPTHALQFNSPARDSADPAGGPAYDQRGSEREIGASDIGAFEIQDNSRWYVTQTADDNGLCDQNCSLREAIAAAPVGGKVEFSPDLNSSAPIIVTSEIDINKQIAIEGQGADKTIIGTDISNHRIFFVNALAVTITGATLTGGGGGSGGAIYVLGGSLTLDGVHFLNNASGQGGGVYYSSFGFNHVIRNSTFSNNDANGGGFYCDGTGAGTLPKVTVVNSTFASNFAVQNGPAFLSNRCNIIARNITVSGNTGINNGGIYVTSNGTLSIGNSIVSGNTATTADPAFLRPEISIFGGGSVASVGNNLIGDQPGEAANTGIPIAYQPTDILDTPPLLGPLQNNGGPTPTRSLLLTSPAINTGYNATAIDPSNGSMPLMTDQRGFLRYIGSPTPHVDIGAFEFGSAANWSSPTPTGANVNVTSGPVTIGFANVTSPGSTSVTHFDPLSAGDLPEGFTLGPGYPAYEISTTAEFTSPLTVCIQAATVLDAIEFNGLNLFHYENGSLVNRTTSRDFASKTVCATVSGLSPFVVARSLAPTSANVVVRGRVLSPMGSGVANARVSIASAARGELRTALTSQFGYFEFTEIAAGESYVLTAEHRVYRFTPMVILVNNDIADADLIAEHGKLTESGKDRSRFRSGGQLRFLRSTTAPLSSTVDALSDRTKRKLE